MSKNNQQTTANTQTDPNKQQSAGAPAAAAPNAPAPDAVDLGVGADAHAADLKAKEQEAEAAKKAATPHAEALIEFVSKDPMLLIKLDEKTTVQFYMGRVAVTEEVAGRLEKHHLYRQDHIYRGDEVILFEGRVISFKGDHTFRKQVKTSREQGLSLFFLDGPANTSVDLAGKKVPFYNNRALVDDEIAQRLRKHMFAVQGRMIELKF